MKSGGACVTRPLFVCVCVCRPKGSAHPHTLLPPSATSEAGEFEGVRPLKVLRECRSELARALPERSEVERAERASDFIDAAACRDVLPERAKRARRFLDTKNPA
jgi:hypothetical protein